MKKHLILEWWQTKPASGWPDKSAKLVAQFYCHLKSPNGQILLVSESYIDLSSVRKLAKALRAAGTQLVRRKRK